LASILEAPTLSAADKSAIVAELQKNIGAAGETVKNFLTTLAENNRLGLIPGVCTKFGELMSASRGEVEMVVTSAQVGGNLSRLDE
jgi:F-type H+-transporting ATPase subunit O